MTSYIVCVLLTMIVVGAACGTSHDPEETAGSWAAVGVCGLVLLGLMRLGGMIW